jgi:plastocyanin
VRVPLPLTLFAVIALAAACGGAAPAATTTAGPTPTSAGPTATSAGPTATPAGTTTATAPAGGGGGSDPANVTCNDGEEGTPVSIIDFAFEPAAVTADAGNTVFWTNTGSTTHTVTFDNGKDCGSLAPTDLLHVNFLAPGTYPFHCNIHKAMTGVVTVNG